MPAEPRRRSDVRRRRERLAVRLGVAGRGRPVASRRDASPGAAMRSKARTASSASGSAARAARVHHGDAVAHDELFPIVEIARALAALLEGALTLAHGALVRLRRRRGDAGRRRGRRDRGACAAPAAPPIESVSLAGEKTTTGVRAAYSASELRARTVDAHDARPPFWKPTLCSPLDVRPRRGCRARSPRSAAAALVAVTEQLPELASCGSSSTSCRARRWPRAGSSCPARCRRG